MRKNRKQKPDRITAPMEIGDEVAESIYHSLRPLDALAVEMDERWGADRLIELVSAETAAKFGAAKAKLDQAIDGNDAVEVAKRAAVMMRGWRALDAEAVSAGRKPLEVDAWVWRDDGDKPHAFVRDHAEAKSYAKQHPGVPVWSMSEVARLAAHFNAEMAAAGKAKELFPASTVEVRKREPLDQDIPF